MQKLPYFVIIFAFICHFSACTRDFTDFPHNAPLYSIAIDAGDGLGFIDVEFFGDNFCGIAQTKEIICYGSMTAPPAGKFQKLIPTNNGACALSTDGKLHCWGGFTTAVTSNIPNKNFSSVSIYDAPPKKAYACGVTTSESAICWGENTDFWSSKGRWYDFSERTVPFSYKVWPGPYYKEVAASEKYACGLDADGKIFCWGGEATHNHKCPGNNRPTEGLPGVEGIIDLFEFTMTGLTLGLPYLMCGVMNDGFWGEPVNLKVNLDYAKAESFLGSRLYFTGSHNQIVSFSSNDGNRNTQFLNSSKYDKKYTDIAVFGSTECGVVASSGEIDCSGFFSHITSDTKPVPLKLKGISYKRVIVNNEMVCGLNNNGILVCVGSDLSIFDKSNLIYAASLESGSFDFEFSGGQNVTVKIPHNSSETLLTFDVQQIKGPAVSIRTSNTGNNIEISFKTPFIQSCSTEKETLAFDISISTLTATTHSYADVNITDKWCFSELSALNPTETISSMSTDASGKIWVGTSEGRFTYLERSSWANLQDSGINSSILWATPNLSGGIFIVAKNSDTMLFFSETQSQLFQNQSPVELKSVFVNPKDNTVLFGGRKGLFGSNRLNPQYLASLKGLTVTQIYAEGNDKIIAIGDNKLVSMLSSGVQVELNSKPVDSFAIDEVNSIIYAISEGNLYYKVKYSKEAWIKYPHLPESSKPKLLASTPHEKGMWVLTKNSSYQAIHIDNPFARPEAIEDQFRYNDSPSQMIVDGENILLTGRENGVYIYKLN